MKKGTSDRFPFLAYLIDKKVSPEVYDEVMKLLDLLEKQWKAEQEEGLLCFESLAFHYVGMLPPELEPVETLERLKEESIHKELVETLLEWIQK